MMNNAQCLLKAVSDVNAEVARVRAEDLFGNGSQVTIEYAGEAYVLSRTRQNKLLLTKPSRGTAVNFPSGSAPWQARGNTHD